MYFAVLHCVLLCVIHSLLLCFLSQKVWIDYFSPFFRLLEMEKDPVAAIWNSLTADGRKLKDVISSLAEAKLYHAADFLAVNVLHGGLIIFYQV